jgi:hypothetical protein
VLVQPFLTPVPPLGSESVLAKALLPIGYVVGAIRIAVLLAIALLYAILVVPLNLLLVSAGSDGRRIT